MNEQELIIVSDSEPREEESGMTSLEPVVAVPDSDEEWEFEEEAENLDSTGRNIILADVKMEMSNFIQQRETPLDVGKFKEQYIKNGSLPIAELDPKRWGWNSYSSMIKDFATTGDFEVVNATRVTKDDFSQHRHLWCFAFDPSNVEHWRYFFDGGFIRIKKDTLSIFNFGPKAQDQKNRSPPQPTIVRPPGEKSIGVEVASNRSRQSRGSNVLPDVEECVKLYGKGTCFEFQKALCFRKECMYRHFCAHCRSTKHGADACPINRRKASVNPSNGTRTLAEAAVDRKAISKPLIRKDQVNNKKKSIVDESLTSLELAEMIAAVGDDAVWDGQRDSQGSGKSITSPSNGKRPNPVSYERQQTSGQSNARSVRSLSANARSVRSLSYVKGYCYKFQEGQCDKRNSCPFKHQCTWCHGSHRGHLCPRTNKNVGGQRGSHEGQTRRSSTRTNSQPKPAARQTPLFSKPAVVPLFSKPALAPVFSKAAQPLVQKPLANSYDAMPSGSGGGYNRNPLSGGYNRTTQKGRAVNRSGGYNRTTQKGRAVNRRRPY